MRSWIARSDSFKCPNCSKTFQRSLIDENLDAWTADQVLSRMQESEDEDFDSEDCESDSGESESGEGESSQNDSREDESNDGSERRSVQVRRSKRLATNHAHESWGFMQGRADGE